MNLNSIYQSYHIVKTEENQVYVFERKRNTKYELSNIIKYNSYNELNQIIRTYESIPLNTIASNIV